MSDAAAGRAFRRAFEGDHAERTLRRRAAAPASLPHPILPHVAPAPPGGRSPFLRFAAAFATVLAVVALAYPYLPRRYEAAAELVLLPTDGDGQADRSLRGAMDENAIQSALDLIRSPELADAVIARNRLTLDPEFARPGWLTRAAGRLGLGDREPDDPAAAEKAARQAIRRRLDAALQVGRDRRSYTVRLGYAAATPEKAAALTTALVDAYLAAQRDRKRASIERLAAWSAKRVALLQARYDATRGEAEAFTVSSGLIDTGAQVYLDQRLQVLGAEAAQARARRIEAQVRIERLAAMKGDGTLAAAPEVIASPTVLRLKESMAAALARTAVWTSETKVLEDEIGREADRILTAAGAEAANWSGREALLLTEVEAVRAETVRRREAETRLREYQRVADSDRLVLDEAQARFKGLTARVEMALPDAEVIAAVDVPNRPAFPKPLLVLLAALVTAALAGLAAIRGEALALARRLARA